MRVNKLIWLVLLAGSLAAGQEKDELLRRADTALNDGKTNQARALYEQAIKAGADLNGDFTRAQNLGLCYLNGTPPDFAKAAHWLDIAVRLRPNSDETRLSYAQALAWGKRFEPAIHQYRTLWEAHPEVSEYALGLANTYYWAGKLDSAFQVFQRFLETNPSHLNMRLEYARLLSFTKRYAEAMGQYQVVLNADPNNLGAQLGVAKVTSWQNDLPGALERYERILKRYPNLYEAQVGKAFTLMWMGREEEARVMFQAAARRNPGDREVAAALKSLPPPKPKPEVAAAPPQPPPVAPVPPPEKVAAAEPPPPPPPSPEDPVDVFMRQAEAAAARGDYTTAVHNYHQVLERRPGDRQAMLQIARVLSWAKSYNDSVAQYEAFLKLEPANLPARLERARVLSWAQQFDASLAEYELALRQLEAAPQPPVPLRDARLEYARVLSWARRYDDSLAQLALLIPAQPQPADFEAVVVKARVLAWSRRYDESLQAWDQALALKPTDVEARVGKAQTVYYSGRLPEAAALLRPILQEDPKHADASLTLASVEHGLGHNGQALRWLKNAPANDDSRQLRSAIRREMRPVLRLRFGYEDDIEQPSAAPSSTIRALRYLAGIEFSVHPDVRMEVTSIVTQGDTSSSVLAAFGPDSLATELMARLTFRPRPWLLLTLGGGHGSTGRGELGPGLQRGREHHFVYDIHPVITHGGLRLDFAATRRVADYTPLAVHDNVIHSREALVVTHTWRQRVRASAEYWHSHYSIETPDLLTLKTAANGGALQVTPTIYRNDQMTVEGGVRYELYGFADSAAAINGGLITSAGFFAPRLYHRYMGTGRFSWSAHPKVQLDLNGTFGPQRISTFSGTPLPEWGTTGSFGSQVTFRLGPVTPYLAYDYFSTATAAAPGQTSGSYKSHSLVVGLTHRF